VFAFVRGEKGGGSSAGVCLIQAKVGHSGVMKSPGACTRGPWKLIMRNIQGAPPSRRKNQLQFLKGFLRLEGSKKGKDRVPFPFFFSKRMEAKRLPRAPLAWHLKRRLQATCERKSGVPHGDSKPQRGKGGGRGHSGQ